MKPLIFSIFANRQDRLRDRRTPDIRVGVINHPEEDKCLCLNDRTYAAHTERQICDHGECMEGLAALVFGWQRRTEEEEPEGEVGGRGGEWQM